jgi:hypothetical protein
MANEDHKHGRREDCQHMCKEEMDKYLSEIRA